MFIEAAPAGGAQLYYAVNSEEYNWGASTISILASIFSISFGMEELVGKYLGTWDRLVLFLYSFLNFCFRVASIAIFVRHFKWAEYTLVPSIYAFEVALFSTYAAIEYDNGCFVSVCNDT